MFIPDPGFLLIPDPGSRVKGSWIRNTVKWGTFCAIVTIYFLKYGPWFSSWLAELSISSPSPYSATDSGRIKLPRGLSEFLFHFGNRIQYGFDSRTPYIWLVSFLFSTCGVNFNSFFITVLLFQDDGDHVVFWSPWSHRLRPVLAPGVWGGD